MDHREKGAVDPDFRTSWAMPAEAPPSPRPAYNYIWANSFTGGPPGTRVRHCDGPPLPPCPMPLPEDLPPHERPRERLLRHGPASLRDAELLALALRTGTRGSAEHPSGLQSLKRTPASVL